MFFKRFAAAGAVAITSLASVASEQPVALKSTDPTAQVPPITYTSVMSSYQSAVETSASPDKVWREANATVAREGMHGESHSGHVPAPQSAGSHPGHQMPAQAASPDSHAGHGAPAKHAGHASHAGHQMSPNAATPTSNSRQAVPAVHAGHQVMPGTKPDAHAGHQMHGNKNPADASRPTPAADEKTKSAHGQHQQHTEHQKKEADK